MSNLHCSSSVATEKEKSSGVIIIQPFKGDGFSDVSGLVREERYEPIVVLLKSSSFFFFLWL